MASKTFLKILFAGILFWMIACSVYASMHQSLVQWGGLTTGPDRYWTLATLSDAYCGFLTFYVWVFYKEPRWLPRIAWFVAIMVFGNMAMASYVLTQLARLRPDESAPAMLSKRNG